MIKSRPIALSDLITQCPGNIVSDMDGEKVMLSVRNGKYYNLGEVGGRIWDSLGKSISVQQIVGMLMSDYDVERAECEQQILSFLDHLRKEGLILVAEENSITVHAE